jgi:uncharacterized protein YjbI with pentapeptide repeats
LTNRSNILIIENQYQLKTVGWVLPTGLRYVKFNLEQAYPQGHSAMNTDRLLRICSIFFLAASIDISVSAQEATPIVINGCVIEPNTDCTEVGTGLKYANLSGADLSGANLSGLTLHGASLRNANLSGANLQRVELDMASLANADLTGADLTDAYFTLSNVAGADFQSAILTNVDLRGANGARDALLEGARFCNTTLPDGTTRDDHCP